MNSKGLGVGQAFTFIVLAVTFSLVMLFGYKSISGLLVQGEQIELVQFQKDLQNSIKVLYTDFGTVREEQFRLPGKYTQVCFVDMDFEDLDTNLDLDNANINLQDNPALQNKDAVAYSVWDDAQTARSNAGNPADTYTGYDAVEYNVFLQPAGLFKVFHIKIKDDAQGERGFLCLPIREGQFSLRLEGKGDHTELGEVVRG